MDITGLGSVFDFGGKVLDKLFQDPTEKAAAKARLMELQQSGELKELEVRMSAIIAEAKSSDPWTSRARPTFMYVIYIMILCAIPMGVLSAFRPDTATAIAAGMKAWLAAIPDGLWATFGIGYTGYSAARSVDKKNLLKR
ncbi:MAG: holin family protein [Geopsychrobacter sp.]|nr:holin family protein [Geopsychrobacter sp.]